MLRKRLTALILTALLLVSLWPAAALADTPYGTTCPDGQHSWGPWDIIDEATCTQRGMRIRVCEKCDEVERETYYVGHRWGAWTTVLEPTDHSAGRRERRCGVCGRTETMDIDPEGTLRRGDSGEDVTELQRLLVCYGALDESGVDGRYGPGTAEAVKQVQRDNGLTEDGVAWPQTQGLLGHIFGEWTTVTEPTDFSAGERARTCSRCGHTETETVWPSPLYRRGDRGEGVQELQQALNDAGYDCGAPDGSFGGKTESAVSAFESANDIEPDGIAWPGVLKLLGVGGAVPLEAGGPSDDGGEGGIGGGDFGDAILLVQADPVKPFVFAADAEVVATAYITNQSDGPITLIDLTIDNKPSNPPVDYVEASWLEANEFDFAPHETKQVQVHMYVDPADLEDGAAVRYLFATATVPEIGDQAEAGCAIPLFGQVEGPSLRVAFTWSPGKQGALGDTVPLDATIYNNGTEDLKIIGIFVTGDGDESLAWKDTAKIGKLTDNILPVGETLPLTVFAYIDEADIAYAAQPDSMHFTDRKLIAQAVGVVSDEFAEGTDVDLIWIDGIAADPLTEESAPLISITADEIDPLDYNEGDQITTTAYLTNLTDDTLKLSYLVIDSSIPEEKVTAEWLAGDDIELAPHGVYPFTVEMIADAADVGDGWGTRTVRAGAVSADDVENESSAFCEIIFVRKTSEPSLFVYFDWSQKWAGAVDDTVDVPLRIYNSGSEDLDITGVQITGRNAAEVAALDELVFPEGYEDYMDVFPAGKSCLATLRAVVTPEDAAYAAIPINNGYTDRNARIEAEPLVSDGPVSDGDYVYIAVLTDGEPGAPEGELWLEVIPDPIKTDFMAKETVDFTVRLHNDTGETLYYPNIMCEKTGEAIVHTDTGAAPLAPGDYFETTHSYTFMAYEEGLVELCWYGGALREDDEPVFPEEVRMTFSVSVGDETTYEVAQPKFTKTVANLPPRGFFLEDEVIDFVVTLENDMGFEMINVVVTDPLATTPGGVIGEYASIPHGESRTMHVYYTVTGFDVDHADYIENYAYVEYGTPFSRVGSVLAPAPVMNNMGELVVPGGMYSNIAYAPIGKIPPEPGPTPVPDPAEPICIRTLVGLGDGTAEFTVDYCRVHGRAQERVQALVSEAHTDEEKLAAWRRATLIWTAALNEEYNALINGAADDKEKLDILTERALFFAQMACRSDALALAYPDDPAYVAMRVSEMVMNRTVDLCYAMHTAPSQRADSVMGTHDMLTAPEAPAECGREVTPTDTGARYTEILCAEHAPSDASVWALIDRAEDKAEAWQAARLIWMAAYDRQYDELLSGADEAQTQILLSDRLAFIQWLNKRELLLERFYPDQPETVAEVLALAVRARLISLCAGE